MDWLLPSAGDQKDLEFPAFLWHDRVRVAFELSLANGWEVVQVPRKFEVETKTFNGEIVWEVNEENKKVTRHFDSLLHQLLIQPDEFKILHQSCTEDVSLWSVGRRLRRSIL
ncbi:MAG: hypothetical protein LAT55_00505 [Opitutales bacterium]|nr:hypothetical protein [Opitutales bacterium]